MPGPTRSPIPMEEPDAWSSRADEDGGQTPAGSEKLAVSNTWTVYVYILMTAK